MTLHTRCFNCGGGDLSIFYEIDGIPVHSTLLMPTKDKATSYPKGDLKLGFCASCGFIQNCVFDVDVHEYSTNCEEAQGFSPTFTAFAKRLAERWIERYDLHDIELLEFGWGKAEFLMLASKN